jgi:hypothetical protein
MRFFFFFCMTFSSFTSKSKLCEVRNTRHTSPLHLESILSCRIHFRQKSYQWKYMESDPVRTLTSDVDSFILTWQAEARQIKRPIYPSRRELLRWSKSCIAKEPEVSSLTILTCHWANLDHIFVTSSCKFNFNTLFSHLCHVADFPTIFY